MNHPIHLGYEVKFPPAFAPRTALIDTPEKLRLAVAAEYNDRDAVIALAECCGIDVPAWFHGVAAPTYGEELTLP